MIEQFEWKKSIHKKMTQWSWIEEIHLVYYHTFGKSQIRIRVMKWMNEWIWYEKRKKGEAAFIFQQILTSWAINIKQLQSIIHNIYTISIVIAATLFLSQSSPTSTINLTHNHFQLQTSSSLAVGIKQKSQAFFYHELNFGCGWMEWDVWNDWMKKEEWMDKNINWSESLYTVEIPCCVMTRHRVKMYTS